MKKAIAILLSLTMILGLAACGNSASQTEQPSTEDTSVESKADTNSAENSTDMENLTSAGVMQGISVIEKDGILEITLPCLLPKKSKKHSCEYLTDPIYYTLSKYAQTHTLPKFRHCVVCFSHIYSRELSPNRVRDYDNLELKQLLDAIATFVMEDDTGLLCDAYNTTDIGDSDCTRVSVMDKERFQGWLSDRENRLRSISDL